MTIAHTIREKLSTILEIIVFMTVSFSLVILGFCLVNGFPSAREIAAWHTDNLAPYPEAGMLVGLLLGTGFLYIWAKKRGFLDNNS